MESRTYYYARVSNTDQNLDRLSRNKADIKAKLEFFKANGIRLKILDLPTTLIELPKGQDWILGNSSAVSFNFRFSHIYMHKI